jgi:hypothetical protein
MGFLHRRAADVPTRQLLRRSISGHSERRQTEAEVRDGRPSLFGDDGTIYFQNGERKFFAIQDTQSNGGLDGRWPKGGAGSRSNARGIL